MIDGNKTEGFVLTCDFCGNEIKYFDTFQEARDYSKENGWQSKYKNNQWNNVCYDCLGKNKNDYLYGHLMK